MVQVHCVLMMPPVPSPSAPQVQGNRTQHVPPTATKHNFTWDSTEGAPRDQQALLQADMVAGEIAGGSRLAIDRATSSVSAAPRYGAHTCGRFRGF